MTTEELATELLEKKEDLEVFVQARDLLYKRIMYVQDHSLSKITPLHEWAGAHAIMNMMDIVIHNMERMLKELETISPDISKPQLRLVKHGED